MTKVDFSLLYFANRDATEAYLQYELLLQSARYADEHEFAAIWVPERHFHPFGGAYPNPALPAAALAAWTSRIRLRAGSVVVPLHNPIRLMEDWSFVDNLSRGRVDIALATGWNANDFVLAPDRYHDRRAYTSGVIPLLQRLWRGEEVVLQNGVGEDSPVSIFPRPVQRDLPLWMTCTSDPEGFREAGRLGLNVLTALLFQRVDELEAKLALYREAREAHGHDPLAGKVTLMLHTFVGESIEQVQTAVRQPFLRYLESSVDLWKRQVQALDSLSSKGRRDLLNAAFRRYFRTAALFGTVETCRDFIDRMASVGVGEIACLIDFGLSNDDVLRGLTHLNSVRLLVNGASSRAV